MKAIGYFREEPTSEDDQPSIAEQNRAFLEHCRCEGWDIGATFLDRDPASNTGFRQMVEYLRQNGPDVCIVVDCLERLGSDTRQIAAAYFQLASLAVPLTCLDGTAAVAEALLAAWKTHDVAERPGERVRAAMRRKAMKGEVLGRPPYGYRVGARRRLEPVPAEAGLVRYMFRLYVHEGLGVRLVARRLNEEGYRTRRGGNWSMVTIRDLLRNRAYLGTYARFGIRVPGSHPPLVSAQDFRLAQERMERRRSGGGPHTQTPFLLSGLVHCGYCGNRLIGVSRRQSWQRIGNGVAPVTMNAEYRYYQCETRTNQGLCDYHTQRASALDEAVRACLELELVADRALAFVDTADSSAALRSLKTRLRLLDRRLEQILDDGVAGRVTTTQLREQGAEWAREQVALDETREILEHRIQHQRDDSALVAERADLLRALAPQEWQCRGFDEQQQIVRRLLGRVTVRDDTFELVLRTT